MGLPFKDSTFDSVSCFGALQMFTDSSKAVSEMSRVLKVGGDFVGQTVVESGADAPLWIKAGDRLLKLGYFRLDRFRSMLNRFQFDLVVEEQSNISYIFKAARRDGPLSVSDSPADDLVAVFDRPHRLKPAPTDAPVST